VDKYPGLFIKISLIYLLLGVTVGLVISADRMLATQFRFMHIHLNLLGFMVMFIAGVAYHVLPRFSSQTIPWPMGIKFHFYLQNIGLLGMLGTKIVQNTWSGDWGSLFLLFSLITASALFVMIYNLFFILLPKNSSTIKPSIINFDAKVAEVLERFPKTREIFLKSGFEVLANPTSCAQFSRNLTIKDICGKHNIDVQSFLSKLNQNIFQDNSTCEKTTDSHMSRRKECC
jgi:hypothetical protein